MATIETRFSNFQIQLLWIALACLACKFILDTASAKELFGTIWISVKQANAVIMWLAAILSGKKFIDLLGRFKKVTEQSQTGEGVPTPTPID